MKILYIPLDERPCNYKFPSMNLNATNNIELITIPIEYMGNKKLSANINKIFSWLEDNLYNCDGAVISLEMLIYGGLLPSRIHNYSSEILIARLNRFNALVKEIKKKKDINIYIFALVMRTPAYSSSEEEPSYYQEYGKQIFRRSFLLDKKETCLLTNKEEEELSNCINKVPTPIIIDYESRRDKNRDIILKCSKLLIDRTIDYLVIPQDDSAQYGYGPKDKKIIFSHFKSEKVENKILTYPGADEVGSALICRCIVNKLQQKPSIGVIFDQSESKTSIPKYEGMVLKDSIKHQINVAGAKFTDDIEKAQIILFIHTKDEKMSDSWLQEPYKYDDFTYKILLNYKKPFIICDVAYANGSDLSFVKEIFNNKINDNMLSYAAWNTAGNTIGTAISSGIVQYLYGSKETRDKLFFYRMIDDCIYQSIVRKKYNELLKDQCFNSYIHIKKSDEKLINEIKNDIIYNLKKYYNILPFSIKKIDFPWDRLFEIDVELGSEL